ncbi:transposase [Lacrimispora brassicae]
MKILIEKEHFLWQFQEYSPKTLKSQFDEFPMDIPRDRNGEYQPMFTSKYKKDISWIEEQVISFYTFSVFSPGPHSMIGPLFLFHT